MILEPRETAEVAMKIVVYGAGGHAKVVLDVLEKAGTCAIVGLLDDSAELTGGTRSGYRVLGGSAIFRGLIEEGVKGMIVALGDNMRRRAVFDVARAAGFELVAAIHPSALLGRRVRIGAGSGYYYTVSPTFSTLCTLSLPMALVAVGSATPLGARQRVRR